jgi:hypothetical protein
MSARVQGPGPTGLEGNPIGIILGGATVASQNAARIQGAGPLGTEGDPIGAVIVGGSAMAIGGEVIGGTPGSVLFVDINGDLGQDNSNFFWDDANNRLGIGTNSPSASAVVHIKGSVTNDDLLRLEAPSGASASSFFFSCRDASAANRFLIAYTGNTQIIGLDALTTTVATTLRLVHQSTATPAGGFGISLDFDLHSDNNTSRAAADIIASWVTAADATRKARLRLRAYDTTDREGLRIEASGTVAMIGFLGAAAVARPAVYTQTGTATRTFPTDPSSAYTGIDNAQAGTVYATVADLNTLRGVVSSLLGVVRQVVDDLGDAAGYGLLND